MLKTGEIRRQVAQRLRELFPKAKAWEDLADLRVAGRPVDVAVKFRLGDAERLVVVEVSSLGQPRQIRAAVTRLAEIHRELPAAYPVAASVYIGPQSARILKDNNLRYLDLSGHCYVALDQAWCESYTYRASEIASYFVPERANRRLMADVARAATAEGRRYAFTLSAGLSLVAPQPRLAALHCYLEGDPAPVAAALGLRPAAETDGALHLLSPYDPGVFYGVLEKAGLKVVSLPQLYADLVNYAPRGAEQAEHLRREAMGY